MPSRRWHQKSHHGCQTCKARKVKCDETRPVCKNCSKQGRPCQFTSEALVAAPPFPGASVPGNTPHYGMIDFQAEQQEQKKQAVTGATQTPQAPPALKYDSSNESKSAVEPTQAMVVSNYKTDSFTASNILDLGLMHHYTRHTYLTISDLEPTRHTWQDAVPNYALSHPFLMHTLLSLAAFHLCILEPNKHKTYSDRGQHHYSLALTLANKVLLNPDQNNCHALFAFSSLGAIISFAVSMVSQHSHSAIIKDMQDTFMMLRGIHVVVVAIRHWIEHGPMATLLRGYVAKEYDLPEQCNEFLQALGKRVSSNETDPKKQEAYLQAIEVGRKALKNAAFDPNDKTLAFTWPIMVTKPYIDALHEGQPSATAILSLYGVILHDLRIYWWAADRGVRLIEAVHAALDESWEDVLQYPVSLMGLSPAARSQSHPSLHLENSFSPPQASPNVKFENHQQ